MKMMKAMAISMFLSTNLFAGQESGGTEGTIYLVSTSRRMAIMESLRDLKSRHVKPGLNLDSNQLQSWGVAAAVTPVLSGSAVVEPTVIIDIDF